MRTKKSCAGRFQSRSVPLLEIASEPEICTVEAAIDYATKGGAILRYLGVNFW
ncbi:MAG: hypothetical protein IPG80_18490 [Anaerolineales bacterium]|nr:hypothetical protein [Anaerolineales bacterium]